MNYIKSMIFYQQDEKEQFIQLMENGSMVQILKELKPEYITCIRADDKATPLHIAVENNQPQVVEELFRLGATANVKDSEGTTPLHIVAALPNAVEVAQLLISNGADINSTNDYLSTALHIAAFQAQQEMVVLLVSKGAQIDCQDLEGRTPLHGACLKGDIAICEVLIRGGAQIDTKDKDGKTPLMTAVFHGHLKVAEFLLNNGAQVNAQTEDKETPLHRCVLSASASSPEVLQLLLDRGADASLKNKDERVPLQLAFVLALENNESETGVMGQKIRLLLEKTKIHLLFSGVGIPADKAIEYEEILANNDVDKSIFGDVDDNRLVQLGISSVGHRMKVLKVLQHIGKFAQKML